MLKIGLQGNLLVTSLGNRKKIFNLLHITNQDQFSQRNTVSVDALISVDCSDLRLGAGREQSTA